MIHQRSMNYCKSVFNNMLDDPRRDFFKVEEVRPFAFPRRCTNFRFELCHRDKDMLLHWVHNRRKKIL